MAAQYYSGTITQAAEWWCSSPLPNAQMRWSDNNLHFLAALVCDYMKGGTMQQGECAGNALTHHKIWSIFKCTLNFTCKKLIHTTGELK